MRYPPDYKKQTRAKILEAANRLFREKGYHGVGVDAVMAEAGLTAGGFYAHFASKEALFSEVIASTSPLPKDQSPQPEACGINGLIKGYLSRWHRENIAQGCPLPLLAPDVVRGSDEARENFELALFRLLEKMGKQLPDDADLPMETALALAGQLVGGIMLSRAVKDGDLSDKILKACRQAALRIYAESSGEKEIENDGLAAIHREPAVKRRTSRRT